MNIKNSPEAQKIMDMRFGCDRLISFATSVDNKPYIRAVNAYYEDGSFYLVTHAQSDKMKQLAINPLVAVCGEWFSGHGLGECLGHVLEPSNAEIMSKLRVIFGEWYHAANVDETDPNVVLLRLKMTSALLHQDGVRYNLEF